MVALIIPLFIGFFGKLVTQTTSGHSSIVVLRGSYQSQVKYLIQDLYIKFLILAYDKRTYK